MSARDSAGRRVSLAATLDVHVAAVEPVEHLRSACAELTRRAGLDEQVNCWAAPRPTLPLADASLALSPARCFAPSGERKAVTRLISRDALERVFLFPSMFSKRPSGDIVTSPRRTRRDGNPR